MITLYVDTAFISPWALSAYVALLEKGVAFEVQRVDLDQPASGRGAVFVRDSATHRVPAMVHDGFALAESTAIAEYLDDCFEGPSLLPRDPRSRAQARMIQAWIRSDLLVLRKARTSDGVFKGYGSPEPLSPEARAAADKLMSTALRHLDAGREHLFGAWSIADTDLAMMLMRLAASGEALPDSLLTYLRGQWTRPSVLKWLEAGGHPKPSI